MFPPTVPEPRPGSAEQQPASAAITSFGGVGPEPGGDVGGADAAVAVEVEADHQVAQHEVRARLLLCALRRRLRAPKA